ncbi:MAG TPA: helix-turn-helix transcriptional regulator [Chitinophagaceae bacterium]|nr:helix-turn-helix transcriptional regulator [Chitinophagaceae bacterium]
MHYGKALMLFRKFKNKTQQDIAEKLKTTQQYVSELEKQNHLNGEKLDRILTALNSNREEWENFKKILPHANENKN